MAWGSAPPSAPSSLSRASGLCPMPFFHSTSIYSPGGAGGRGRGPSSRKTPDGQPCPHSSAANFSSRMASRDGDSGPGTPKLERAQQPMPSDGQWAMNYSETPDACLRSGLRVICGETQQATLSGEAPLVGTGPASGAEGEGLVRLVSQAWGEFVSVALVSARRGQPPQGAGPGPVPGMPGFWRPGDTLAHRSTDAPGTRPQVL